MATPDTSELAAQTVVQKVSAVSMYGGSGAAIIFGLTAQEFAALLGAAVAVIGLIVNVSLNWYYHHRRFQLDLERHRRKLGETDD